MRNWYQKEIRKWGYGYQLHLAADQANEHFGREPERFREGTLAYPCLKPDCISDHNTLRELESHMRSSHCRDGWKHWDLYYLELSTGCAYQNAKYRDIFIENDFRYPLPPSYPPPPPPGQTIKTPKASASPVLPSAPQDSPSRSPGAPQIDLAKLHPKNCRSDLLETMMCRLSEYYLIMANDYCRGLPEDPRTRYDNFNYLVKLTLPRLAKKLVDIEQWNYEEVDHFRFVAIDGVKSIRRKLNAFEQEQNSGTFQPVRVLSQRIESEGEESLEAYVGALDISGDVLSHKILAIYANADEAGTFTVHATERLPQDEPFCCADKSLLSKTEVRGFKYEETDLFINIKGYLTWEYLQRAFSSTMKVLDTLDENSETEFYSSYRPCERNSIGAIQRSFIEDPETQIAGLYSEVTPPSHAIQLNSVPQVSTDL